MVGYFHPGVYVQEVPSAVRPIQAVSTSTAAFIGVTDMGPIPGRTLPTGSAAQPVLVTSFTDYLRQFGSYRLDSFLTYSVQNFFDNGGLKLYIVRVADSTAACATGTVTPAMQLRAAHPGTWSNLLRYHITPGSAPNKFNLTVQALGMTSTDFLDQFTDMTTASAQATINASKYVQLPAPPTFFPPNGSNLTLGGGVDGSGATPAAATLATGTTPITVNARYPGVWAQAANGNLTVSVEPATDTLATDFNLIVKLGGKIVEQFPNLTFIPATGVVPPNYGRTYVNARSQYIVFPTNFSVRPTDAADVPFTGGSDGGAGSAEATGPVPITISAVNEGAWGNNISVAITSSSDNDPNNFMLSVYYNNNPAPVETFDRMTYQGSPTLLSGAKNPGNYARTVVNSASSYIAITTADTAFTAVPTTGAPATPLQGGFDWQTGPTIDYIGLPASDNTVTGTGLHALDKITDVNLIAIPGQGDAATVSAGMDYCKNQRQLKDCFFIGDVGSINISLARSNSAVTDVSKVSDVQAYATTNAALDKSAGDFGAIYYPWVWAADPVLGVGRNPRILLPPSGFIAGIYARIDNSRGVFKAPAGTEAGVADALAAATNVSDAEQDILNPINVNVIRTVPGSGIVVWGTRTIGSDASWRYIPVRRIAIFIRVSIYYGIQWAVFEPNDEPLWASLRLNIRSFMLTQFRAGAFQGSKPDDAFFVKCDSTTTTQQDIDNGVVNILVGFAPLKPAEFVVLKLSQKVNQPAS